MAVGYGARSIRTVQEAWQLCLDKMRSSNAGLPTWSKVAAKCDDLAVLSNFFTDPWKAARLGISNWQQNHEHHDIELFNETGYVLQKLTRFHESIEAFESAVHGWHKYLSVAQDPSELAALHCGAIRDLVLLGKSLYMHLALAKFKEIAQRILQHVESLNSSLNELNEKQHKTASLRLIDGYAFLAWSEHLDGRPFDQIQFWAQYDEFLAKRVAKDGSEFIRTQKMLTRTRCLIEDGHAETAIEATINADRICQTAIVSGAKSATELETDILFNGLLRGMARNRVSYPSIERIDQAREELQRVLECSYKADLLDCWLHCHIELARCETARIAKGVDSTETIEYHLQQVETFLKHTPIPRVQMEVHLVKCVVAVQKRESFGQRIPQVIFEYADSVHCLANDTHYLRKQQEVLMLQEQLRE